MRITNNYDKEVKIAIVGIGFETSHEEIARACDGWVGHVDTMIWGDGRFEFFDAPNDYSENGWLDFAEKRYKDKCEFIPYQFAGRQVDKRQRYLDLAGKHKCDFAIAVDTDEYVHPQYNDFDKFYRNLVNITEALPEDRMFYQKVFIPSNKLWPKQGNDFQTNKWLPSAKIHKDPGSMRFCCDRHYIWCDKKTTDTQLYKWQLKHPDRMNPLEFQARLPIDGVRIGMDRTLRNKKFNRQAKKWAFLNSHAENSRQYYKIAALTGVPTPSGYNSWAEFEAVPHTFDKHGRRIELQDGRLHKQHSRRKRVSKVGSSN